MAFWFKSGSVSDDKTDGVSCGKGDSCALIGGDDIMTGVKMIGDIGTHVLQEAVGYARVEVHSLCGQRIDK